MGKEINREEPLVHEFEHMFKDQILNITDFASISCTQGRKNL